MWDKNYLNKFYWNKCFDLNLRKHFGHQFGGIKQLIVVEKDKVGFSIDHADLNAAPLTGWQKEILRNFKKLQTIKYYVIHTEKN